MRARHGAQRQIADESRRADVTAEQPRGDQSLQLGREEKRLGCPSIVDRLDAETVAREQQAPTRSIPEIEDREGEHPAQPLHDRIAPPLVPPQDHLRVASRSECTATRLELVSQCVRVVDLSVVCDLDRPVRRRHRHPTGRGEITDRQPAVHETGCAVARKEDVRVIGASMRHRIAHGEQASGSVGK